MVKHIEKDIIKNLYNSYKEKCVNEGLPSIRFSKFKKIHVKARELLLTLDSKNITDNVPYCILTLDENWLYWIEIINEEVVVNFITPEQYKFLFYKEFKKNKEVKIG